MRQELLSLSEHPHTRFLMGFLRTKCEIKKYLSAGWQMERLKKWTNNTRPKIFKKIQCTT
jgi:hypothetical protein